MGAAEGDTADVREDIVGDDKGGRKEEPDHALEDVVHDKVGLNDNEVQSHVSPREVGELELVVTGLERTDEEDEAWAMLAICTSQSHPIELTKDVEQEADEAVVRCQRQQDLVNQNNVLEVVDDRLAVEEVHGGREPIPVQTLG